MAQMTGKALAEFMEGFKNGTQALDYCIEAETAGRIPVLTRLEPTSPPGEIGACCEIGYDGDKYVARVVDAISEADYITANREEFWKLPPSLTTALQAKRAHVEALLSNVGGRHLPNVRYEKSKLNKEIAERVRLYNASELTKRTKMLPVHVRRRMENCRFHIQYIDSWL
jgi:hypothetical protein